MAKNQLAVSNKKKQFIEVTTIIKDPGLKARLQNYIDEIIKCKTAILDQNESIRVLRDSAVDELNVEPKMLNTLVGLFFNNNFEQKQQEMERIDAAIRALLNTDSE